MKRNNIWLLISLFTLFLFSGCALLVVGGAAVGASTGTFFYITGELKTDYYASFDKVWSACENTVAQGTITTVINGEKVNFDIKYKSKNFTTVSIRVGLIGDKLSSQLLQDKIAENLAKNKI
jgi:hypothetical protein